MNKALDHTPMMQPLVFPMRNLCCERVTYTATYTGNFGRL